MVSSSVPSDLEQAANGLLDWIVNAGINGLGVLTPAEKVAEDHRRSCKTIEDATNSVIAWNAAYAAGTGFVTGLGGLATLPIALPASLAASYALAANTIAAIACLRGYDIYSEQVKTMILLSLIGGGAEEILKGAGIAVGNKVCLNVIKQVPGKVLIEINKKVGFRLITKVGEKGVINLSKMVPIAGGVVGGGFDCLFINTCGHTAKKVFPSQKN